MTTPTRGLLVVSAVIGGLVVAGVVVVFDLQPGRLMMWALMGLGVFVTGAVMWAIQTLVVERRSSRASGTYAVFDPRFGQDYRCFALHSSGEFSSLAENMFVIHARGVDWTRVAAGLDTLFAAAGGRAGYVVYWPWWPGLKEKKARFRAAFDGASGTFEHTAVQGLTTGFGAAVLALRSQLGGSGAGKWVFGSGGDISALKATLAGVPLDDPMDVSARLVGSADATLVLEEAGLSVLFVAMKPAVFDAVAALSSGLDGAGYQLRETPEW